MPVAPVQRPQPPAHEVVRFGGFSLVTRRRELLFRGTPVTIGSRAFDVLTALVQRQGQLATKDELLAVVWAGTVVDENNLAAQVSAVRKILAADRQLSRCVQTVPGRGYRFVADTAVEVEPAAGLAAPAPMGSTVAEALSLVVMPFASLGSDIALALARGARLQKNSYRFVRRHSPLHESRPGSTP